MGANRGMTPGPGAYSSTLQADKKPPSWGFGTSQREMMRASSAPGPGQYQPMDKNKSAAPACGFGSSARDKTGGYQKATPGPGAYAPDFTATRKGGPKYTATPRRDAGGAGRGVGSGT